MLAFLKALLLLPVAIVVVLLAVANRAPVVFSLDPFARGTPELSITAPLFALMFAALFVGAVVGGLGAWAAAGKHRRARRMSSREIGRLQAEADRLRTSLAARQPALPPSGAVRTV
jgi:hypothetical protein